MKENKVKYEYTKTPLDYQITEYDCGATTLLNALRYLFKNGRKYNKGFCVGKRRK